MGCWGRFSVAGVGGDANDAKGPGVKSLWLLMYSTSRNGEGDGSEAGDYEAYDSVLGEAVDGSVDGAGWVERRRLERMKFDGDDVVDRGGSDP